MNATLGFNEMILDEIYGPLTPDVRSPLDEMHASGKHLLRLINNVLDLAKIEAGRMELSLQDYSVHDTARSVRSIATYTLLEAVDGETGVAKAMELGPDLILTDIQLPKISGLEAMRRMRADPSRANTPHHCDHLVRALRR